MMLTFMAGLSQSSYQMLKMIFMMQSQCVHKQPCRSPHLARTALDVKLPKRRVQMIPASRGGGVLRAVVNSEVQ